MPLLAMHIAILPENLLDDLHKRFQLPFLAWFALSIAGWLRVLQYLLERVPMNVELPAHASPTSAFDKHQPSNLSPLLHIRKHPQCPHQIPNLRRPTGIAFKPEI